MAFRPSEAELQDENSGLDEQDIRTYSIDNRIGPSHQGPRPDTVPVAVLLAKGIEYGNKGKQES
jgi:hypothetical protein